MKKVISVIVTTYNAEKSIARTLGSILNQEGIGTEFEIELIVVDDCSTDQTVQIAKKYDPILLSTEENSGGPNKGRNIGMRHASGDYICIMDHDDEWLPHKIISQLPYLQMAPIVTSGCTFIDHTANTKDRRVLKSENGFVHYAKNETFLNRLSRNFKNQNAYESSAIYWAGSKNILYEEYFGMVDYDRQLKLYHNRESIEVSQSLVHRHIHDQNLSKTGKYWLRDGYMSLMAIGQYTELYPREAQKGMKNIYGKLGRYYYLYANNMPLARYFFRQAERNWKTMAFIVSSYGGSRFVRQRLKKVTGEIEHNQSK